MKSQQNYELTLLKGYVKIVFDAKTVWDETQLNQPSHVPNYYEKEDSFAFTNK